ncbi:UNVERIFIED_ORG: L-idonate 5-dehydrogenase [Martelella mediterranea]
MSGMPVKQADILRLHAQQDLRLETCEAAAPGLGQVRIAMERGGICGSDLHYFAHGGVGQIRVREPIILGHEAAGRIEAIGQGVDTLTPGMLVAVNPSRPCGHCRFCRSGMERHCTDMHFMGSAMHLPHEQGLYRSYLTVDAAQCFAFPEGISAGEAACSEPLAVCLHAVSRVPSGVDKLNVLVTGCGPIGCLTIAAAKAAGAAHIVATDLNAEALEVASKMGADVTIDLKARPNGVSEEGPYDVAFECSAASQAVTSAIEALEPCGVLVEVGVAGTMDLPVGRMVAREISYIGTHRFDSEFADAVNAIGSRRIDVRPIITRTYPMNQAGAAFALALDKSKSCKVHIALNETEDKQA